MRSRDCRWTFVGSIVIKVRVVTGREQPSVEKGRSRLQSETVDVPANVEFAHFPLNSRIHRLSTVCIPVS